MHIAVIRCDIEITQHNDVLKALHFGCNPTGYLLKPVHLVGVFFRAYFGAIDDVQVQDAHITNTCTQNAPLRVIQPIDISDNVRGWLTAEYGDAVIGLLPRINAVVACIMQFINRETIVGQLGFL